MTTDRPDAVQDKVAILLSDLFRHGCFCSTLQVLWTVLQMSAISWLKLLSKTHSFSCFLVMVLLSATTQGQTPLFPITNTLSIGAVSTPAVGDFNGDGQPDLIYSPPPIPTGSNQFATLTVLLNEGAATNPTPVVTSSLTCTSVTSLMVADMNKDQKQDVVLTCAEGFVAVLFGNGDGTFQKPVYYAVPTTSVLILPKDLNGDGYPDVAVSTPSSVIVLLNQGSNAAGTLSAPTSYPAPGIQFGLIGAGDFNGDGKLDLLGVANQVTQTDGFQFITYLGNGDGTFQASQIQQTPFAGAAVIADVNHDGISDVVYIADAPAAGASQTIQILLGNSGGKLTLGTSLSLDPATNYTSLALAGSTSNNGININLALGGPATTILLGDGKGGFTVGQTYAIAGSPLQEIGSNGNTNLVFFTPSGVTLLPGNGDGTFQGLPNLPVGPTGFVSADVNGDGLSDVLYINAAGNLITALGRGNGTFSITNQAPATANEFLLAGDFNADGHTDIVAILPNSSAIGDSQLFFYRGNGDGSFQPASASVDLLTTGAIHAIAGDFNGDGHVDVVISTYGTVPNQGQSGQALIFVPGNGDGTFGIPVLFSSLTSFNTPSSLFSADLNNDKKLDLIWNGSIYLGNGNGTFLQQPLSLVGPPLAVGDLNGDSIPDIVIQPAGLEDSAPGANIYAGNGDGTFQSVPFFTTPSLPSGTSTTSALIGDVNGDGHADLLLQSQTPDLTTIVSVSLGDGKGDFTADPNTYFAGSLIEGSATQMPSPMATFARLNNQAPALPKDNSLDYLAFTSNGATTLLNQTNPTPAAPTELPSKTTLAVSASIAAPTQQLTLTATVTGLNPTGKVTFTSGNTTLGTASLNNGVASFLFAFTTAGNFTVTANYTGDANNLASFSNPVPVTVATPDFTISATPTTATISAGQPATTLLTITAVGTYSGTVTFSCGNLPAESSCTFAPASVTLANGAAVTTRLTLTTTAHPLALLRTLAPLHAIALASLILLFFSPNRSRRLRDRLVRASLLTLFFSAGLLPLASCSSSSPKSPTTTNPGTPNGVQNITVTVADSVNNISHSLNFQLTVQ